jgi:hypothetical protein
MKLVHYTFLIPYNTHYPNDIYTPINMLKHSIDVLLLKKCTQAVIDHANTRSNEEIDMTIFPSILWVLDKNYLKQE